MTAWYNEPDSFAADWLESLIFKKLIAHGVIDRRPIQEIHPTDLNGFRQCHFFAGIGGWSYALRLAQWPDALSVWTGSCPCQPFSNSGSKRGTSDDRHLWPYFRDLIAQCCPPVCFGEQVTSPLGRSWLASIRADLEKMGYGVGAADLCAASIGAPHIRQRLYWVAESAQLPQRTHNGKYEEGRISQSTAGRHRYGDRVAYSDKQRLEGWGSKQEHEHSLLPWAGSMEGGTCGRRSHRRHEKPMPRPSDVWSKAEYLALSDGSLRPTQPGLFPLAHGVPFRVGRLRGYGNAIVPQVAAEFIRAYLDTVPQCTHSGEGVR